MMKRLGWIWDIIWIRSVLMAIKGKGYIKTTWSFQERPVASSKLNAWDDNVESALELLHNILALAWGGGDGVIRAATEGDLEVVANSPPDLSVTVRSGRAFISKFIYKLAEDTTAGPVTPPVSNPRIDLVQAELANWIVSVATGEESADPSPPSPSVDCIALAQIYLRVGMTCIKDADDSVNGYIVDVRTFL
jgi:hypothetical protein